MSPRAAWRLERLGFGPVYDYAAGKVDWMAAGLPTVRTNPSERRALDVADRQPPVCRPDAAVSDVAAMLANHGRVLVVDDGVVLGRLRATHAGDAAQRVEHVMDPGPTTVRAHEPLDPLLDRMAARRVSEVIVTTPEGRLLGVVRREEAAEG